MKRYRVFGQEIQDVAIDVEAESEDEAVMKAFNAISEGSDDVEQSHTEPACDKNLEICTYDEDSDYDIDTRVKYIVDTRAELAFKKE